ncbi:hypothetical protein ABEB36_015270 [Hypothenemus hampei]|uniref:Uncharacterized protein n=1 Tax=Hypothenemus hampei TaxID=57062 RepID=A0ABD1E0N0_HYPHA
MSWATVEIVDELLTVARSLILERPGIPLGVLEDQFFVVVQRPDVLTRLGLGSFGDLLSLSPSLIVHAGKCYVAGVDEASSESDGESDYFAPG